MPGSSGLPCDRTGRGWQTGACARLRLLALAAGALMFERPGDIADADVLAAVRTAWDPDVDRVDYRAVGFGAHHWCASRGDAPALFVTVDALDPRRDLADLTASYAGAAALREAGLEFVHAGLRPFALPFAGRAISATPWLAGRSPEAIDPDVTRRMFARLHAAVPPPVPVWRPLVAPEFARDLHEQADEPWAEGPLGERARAAIASRLADITAWTATYHRLADRARRLDWVPTHGEPHQANQVVDAAGTVLVDWESLRLAPAERDLRVLGEGRREMLELFDLEWRLDEIRQYATWFAGPHDGGVDDEVALGALEHELNRP